MDNKIDFFVENKRLDVDNVDFAITYSFNELSNPQDITGDYSKTITIKGTQNNNEVFGQIWNFDRTILQNEASNVGVYFNASKRADCKIFINGGLFKAGYLKLNAVNMNKGVYSYDVTFYSTLCNILHKLEEKKLVDLSFPNDLKHTINASTVSTMWNNTHSLSPYMTYVMANNGLYNEFENAKMMTYDSTTAKYIIKDVVDGVVELDECSKGEYRSYYQRPALNVGGILDKIVYDYNNDDTEKTTLSLSSNFFNGTNPYYRKSVMTLPQYNIEEKFNTYYGVHNGYYGTAFLIGTATASEGTVWNIPLKYNADSAGIFDGTSNINLDAITGTSDITIELEMGLSAQITNATDVAKLSIGSILTPRYSNTITCEIKAYLGRLNTDGTYSIDEELIPYSTEDSQLKISYAVVEMIQGGIANATCYFNNPYTNFTPKTGRGTKLLTKPIHFHSENKILPADDYVIFIRISKCSTHSMTITTTGTNKGTLITSFYNANVKALEKPLFETGSFNANNYYPANGINYENPFTGADITIVNNSKISTDSLITKKLMIDDEIKQSDFLINYTKTFGLLYDTDVNNNIIIKDRNEYFKNYKILDWGNKVDYSKAIKQTPITFDSRYIQFDYNNGETYYEGYYKNKFGIEFGCQKLNTGYQFNNNTKKLIEDNMFNNTIVSKERTRMVIGSNYINTEDEKILPALFIIENNQRNQSDTKYNLLFYNGTKSLTNSVVISDDTLEMYDESIDGGGKACWIDTNNTVMMSKAGRRRSTYPLYSTLTSDGNYSWNLGYPRESYAGFSPADYPSTSTIYSLFWKNYIEEIYNVDNKIVKCYMRLSPNDMCNFSFRNFIKAFGCLWHVNKINNYNPLNTESTEVELIKVTDINAYITGQKSFSTNYTVTYDLYGVTSSNTATMVEGGDLYITHLSANEPITALNVYMDGLDITNSVVEWEDDWTGLTLTIEQVTGNLEIRAATEEGISVASAAGVNLTLLSHE